MISRHRATDTSQRQGTLVVNPVGPGGHGNPVPFVNRPAAKYYDLVGMAPRGDRPSTQVQCSKPGPIGEFTWDQLPSRPTDRQLSLFSRQAREHEKSCAELDDGLRPYITTANIARDLDIVRSTLDEPLLNHVAGSQATVVAGLYGTLFPHHTGKVVLDSTLGPGVDWHQFQVDSVPQKAVVIRSFARWAGARDDTFHLGHGAAAVLRTIDDTSRRLAKRPMAGLTQSRFDGFVAQGAHDRPRWDEHATTLHQLATGKEPRRQVAAHIGVQRTNYEGAIYSYTCESDWPRKPRAYYPRMRHASAHMPYGYAAALSGPSNCTFRSYKRPEPPIEVSGDGLADALIVQSDTDLALPYQNGVHMANRTGAALLRVNDSQEHTPYTTGRNKCITNTVNDYLLHRKQPAHRTSCGGTDLPPDVPADR